MQVIQLQYILQQPTSMASSPSQQYDRNPSFLSDFEPPKSRFIEHEPYGSSFFKDHCEQQYVIHRAFNSNNFTYLRKVPDNLKHGTILEQREKKVKECVFDEAENRSKTIEQKEADRNRNIHKKKLEQIGTLGYFETFPYEESLYTVGKQIQANQKNQSDTKRKMISELDFRPSGIQKKNKYENPFEHMDKMYKTQRQPYLFPFHTEHDHYDAFHESQMRHKIIEQAKILYGDFIPSKNEKSLTKMVIAVESYIKKYIKEMKFFIGVTKKDEIDILFSQEDAESTKVQVLMSKLCDNETLIQYLLIRNPTRWASFNPHTKYVEFSLLPPWAKEPQLQLTTN